MSERNATITALILLFAAGAVAWWFELRAPLRPDSAPLASLPFEISSFVGNDSAIGENVEEMLDADFNLQRVYVHPLGQVVWMYVGYYGTERGGTPEHSPRECYVAHGWTISDQRTIVTNPETGDRAIEYLVESGGQRQLVLYWYRSYRSTSLLSTFSLQLDHFLGKLSNGRGDGALIRLSTPLNGIDRDAGRALLVLFARELETAVARVWPMEGPVAEETDGQNHRALEAAPLQLRARVDSEARLKPLVNANRG